MIDFERIFEEMASDNRSVTGKNAEIEMNVPDSSASAEIEWDVPDPYASAEVEWDVPDPSIFGEAAEDRQAQGL